MISRLTSEARIPSWPIEMPSDTVIVPNSSGKPPARCTPSLAALGQPVERHVARGDLVPRRRDADLRLGEVVVGHADGAQHPARGGLLDPVGDVAAAGLEVVRGGGLRHRWPPAVRVGGQSAAAPAGALQRLRRRPPASAGRARAERWRSAGPERGSRTPGSPTSARVGTNWPANAVQGRPLTGLERDIPGQNVPTRASTPRCATPPEWGLALTGPKRLAGIPGMPKGPHHPVRALRVAPCWSVVTAAAAGPAGLGETAVAAGGRLAALELVAPRSERRTSSAACSGTSTSESRSGISIAPMSRPVRLDSPAIAPTRSCGRTPSRGRRRRTAARRARSAGASPRRAARRADAGAGRAPGAVRRGDDAGSPRRRRRAPAASWASFTAASGDLHRGRTRRPARRHARTASSCVLERHRALEQADRSASRVRASRRARRSATVGTFSTVIGCAGRPARSS